MPELTSRTFAQRIDAPLTVEFPGSHLGLTWRHLGVDDAADLARLLAGSQDSPLGLVRATEKSSRAHLANLLENHDAADIIGGWDTHGELCAYGEVRVNTQPLSELQADVRAVVHPTWSGRGLGRAILEWQDNRARSLMTNFPTDLPVSIRAQVNAANVERRRLLAAGGFCPIGRVTTMRVELNEEHAKIAEEATRRLAEHDLHIETYEPSVSAELMRLHNRLILSVGRFQPMSNAVWDTRIAQDMSALLVMGNTLVGYILSEAHPRDSLLSVNLYGIDRPFRRQGIATNMLLALLGRAAKAGYSQLTVPIVSESEPKLSLLEKYGFQSARTEIIYAIDI